ncbi:MAG: SWIM zinc finger family protein [Halobacteriota archaeon]|jgi:predicted nucleic acid-binding Zn finger protein
MSKVGGGPLFADAFKQQIEREYGNRGKKGLEIAKEGRVKRYKDFYVVVGEADEYIVEDAACTCKDFLFNPSRNIMKCSHMIAVEIAKQKGLVDFVNAWYQDVRPLP